MIVILKYIQRGKEEKYRRHVVGKKVKRQEKRKKPEKNNSNI